MAQSRQPSRYRRRATRIRMAVACIRGLRPPPLPPSVASPSVASLPPSIPPSIPPVSLTHFHSVGIRGSGQGARGAHSCPLSNLVRGLHDENIVVVWELVWKVNLLLTGVCISTFSPSKTTRHTRNATLAVLVVVVVLLLAAHESGRCSRERSPLSDRAKLPPRWTVTGQGFLVHRIEFVYDNERDSSPTPVQRQNSVIARG